MTVQINQPSHVLLTAEEVERWQKEYVEATATVADRRRKLMAAAVFFPEAAAVLVEAEPVAQANAARAPTVAWKPQEPTLAQRLVQVLESSQRAMTPREIRAALESAGHSVGGENYLYTVIKRAVDRGMIKKSANGYGPASNGSPEGETAAREGGGSFDMFTQVGGAVPAVPEAGGT